MTFFINVLIKVHCFVYCLQVFLHVSIHQLFCQSYFEFFLSLEDKNDLLLFSAELFNFYSTVQLLHIKTKQNLSDIPFQLCILSSNKKLLILFFIALCYFFINKYFLIDIKIFSYTFLKHRFFSISFWFLNYLLFSAIVIRIFSNSNSVF